MTREQTNTGAAHFDQAAHWRTRGDAYRHEIAGSGDAFQRLLRRQEEEFASLLSALPLSGVESVLEIGCGYGRMTPAILGALPGIKRYRCLDISRGQVAGARASLSDHLQRHHLDFVVGDVHALPLRRRHDLVVAVEVLLHFPPHEVAGVVAALQEVAGRYLVHVDPFEAHRESAIATLRARVRALLRSFSGGGRRTDWLHPYPSLYRADRVAALNSYSLLDGRQHVFVVEHHGFPDGGFPGDSDR